MSLKAVSEKLNILEHRLKGIGSDIVSETLVEFVHEINRLLHEVSGDKLAETVEDVFDPKTTLKYDGPPLESVYFKEGDPLRIAMENYLEGREPSSPKMIAEGLLADGWQTKSNHLDAIIALVAKNFTKKFKVTRNAETRKILISLR